MANPEICETCGGEIVDGICCTFRKAEQESEQQLTHYYKTIFTLKNGKQIEICHKETFQSASKLKSEAGIPVVQMEGFIISPLLVYKSIEIVLTELAGIETIKDPCIAQVIPWPEDEESNHFGIDGQLINIPSVLHCDDSFGPLEERDKIDKPLSTHSADLSEIDGAGQDRTKRVNPQIGSIEN